MIGRLSGSIVERGLDGTVVLDVGGVGYEVAVPLGALGKIEVGERATLHVHTHVREDQIALFGFASAEDRAAFRVLMSVSSVGPKLAMAILSHVSARDLARAVAAKDASAFKGIPGVGKKIGERLVLELRDKLGFIEASITSSGTLAPVPTGGPLAQVVAVLANMGWKPSEAERAVASIAKSSEGKALDALVREALAAMS